MNTATIDHSSTATTCPVAACVTLQPASEPATTITSPAISITPLEIHPSVDPELARGLMAALTHIERHPEQFDMSWGYAFGSPERDGMDEDKGCLICHVERLSNWRRSVGFHAQFCAMMPSDYGAGLPLGDAMRIYSPVCWREGPDKHGNMPYHTTAGRFARVEHFLRTGE